jgi:hypothetical protein
MLVLLLLQQNQRKSLHNKDRIRRQKRNLRLKMSQNKVHLIQSIFSQNHQRVQVIYFNFLDRENLKLHQSHYEMEGKTMCHLIKDNL